ncbi:hypothetical protein V8E36_008912 [Tilletia maclaganii]
MDYQAIRSAVQKRDVNLYTDQHEQLGLITFRSDMLNYFIDAVFVQALGRPEEIDELLNFLGQVARKLSALIKADEFAEDGADVGRGGQALLQRFVERLGVAVSQLSKTEVTPDEDDMEFLKPNYWHTARVHGILLARFATMLYGPHAPPDDDDDGVEDLSDYADARIKDALWDQALVPLLGRTIFSRTSCPPPNGLVTALAVLEGAAGTLIKEMKPKGSRSGQGMNWIWWDNAFSDPKRTWDFGGVVGAVQQGVDGQYADRFMLPGGLISGYADLASRYAELEEEEEEQRQKSEGSSSGAGASGKLQNRSAKTLYTETFGWVSELKPDGLEVGLRVDRASALVRQAKQVLARLEEQENDSRYGYDGRALVTDAEELQKQLDTLNSFAQGIGVRGKPDDGWDWSGASK